MNDAQARTLIAKLDQAVRLLAHLLAADKNQRQQCELLHRAGFAPREIAELLGTSANTVRVQLFNARKARKRSNPLK